MADGALRSDVLAALRDVGVEVSIEPNDWYRLIKADSLECVPLGKTVSRGKAEQLCRVFGTSIGKMFPPLKIVEFPTSKAAGAERASPPSS